MGPPEVQATPGGSTSAFGLVFADLPLVAGSRTVKIVWRVTGRGALHVSVRGPGGQPEALRWGPQYHAGSSYDRPGEEWGTGLVLDRPGCWEVGLRRSTGAARVWLRVRPPHG